MSNCSLSGHFGAREDQLPSAQQEDWPSYQVETESWSESLRYSGREQRWQHVEAERLGGLSINGPAEDHPGCGSSEHMGWRRIGSWPIMASASAHFATQRHCECWRSSTYGLSRTRLERTEKPSAGDRRAGRRRQCWSGRRGLNC